VRGFTNIFRKQYAIVNLDALNRFPDDTVVTPKLLKSVGIVKKLKDGVKVLGNGELEKSLTVKAHCFSKSAVSKIKNAGGKAEQIGV
jgi:large subunit ribosomal protein L15